MISLTVETVSYPTPCSAQLEHDWSSRSKKDGLSDVKYELISYQEINMYTNVTVKIFFTNMIPGKFWDKTDKEYIQMRS